MDKLSIVIPAYNAANVIERCLDSILDQDYHMDVEIIVVNDGSTDNTAEVVAGYAQRYPDYFRIITKENGGLPSARNAGMDVAQGDWIWFCDADDYIMKNGLSYVLDHFVDSTIDICTFSSVTLDPIALKTFKEPDHINASVFYDGPSLSGLSEKTYHFAWNHIFRLAAIQDIRYRNVVMVEDMLFNLEVYRKNLRLRCTNANIYRYTVSENQLTRKRDPKSMRGSLIGYENLLNYAKDIQDVEGKHDPSLSDSIDLMILDQSIPFLSRALSTNLKASEFKALIKRMKQAGIFPVKGQGYKKVISNSIIGFPSLYPLFSILNRKVVVPYVLPRLSRN